MRMIYRLLSGGVVVQGLKNRRTDDAYNSPSSILPHRLSRSWNWYNRGNDVSQVRGKMERQISFSI